MMASRMRSPLGRAIGLGSAKEGVDHWWAQRITAIALVPLSLWFVASVISLAGADDDHVITVIGNLVGRWHARLRSARRPKGKAEHCEDPRHGEAETEQTHDDDEAELGELGMNIVFDDHLEPERRVIKSRN